MKTTLALLRRLHRQRLGRGDVRALAAELSLVKESTDRLARAEAERGELRRRVQPHLRTLIWKTGALVLLSTGVLVVLEGLQDRASRDFASSDADLAEAQIIVEEVPREIAEIADLPLEAQLQKRDRLLELLRKAEELLARSRESLDEAQAAETRTMVVRVVVSAMVAITSAGLGALIGVRATMSLE